MVRAKFRVLSHSIRDSLVVELHPVTPRSQYEPEGSEENRQFWTATPSGSLSLRFDRAGEDEARARFPIGSAWYIDVQAGEGAWQFDSANLRPNGGMDLGLSLADADGHMRYAELKLGIDNHIAAAILLAGVASGYERVQAWRHDHPDTNPWSSEIPRARWAVTLTRA